jgi:hypothetical protein
LLYSPDWPQISNPPASASWVLAIIDLYQHTWLKMISLLILPRTTLQRGNHYFPHLLRR